MRGISNLSVSFWIWLIFILELNMESVSGFEYEYEYESEPETLLKIPALGRISHGIGSLYDGRSGNFLPLEFSVISEKTRLKPKVINSTGIFSFKGGNFPLYRPSGKLAIVFEEPRSSDIDWTMGSILLQNYDGLALRAVLGMLEFPENGSAGFLLDKITLQEMGENSTKYRYHFSPSFEDELNLPGSGSGKNYHRQDKLVRREMRRNLKSMDIKILKKATHVVVKVTRGSQTVKTNSVSASASVTSDQVFSDTNDSLSSSPVPLSFELMPLLQFFNESGLKMTSSTKNQIKSLELDNWRNPMEIRHGRTFTNLDWSWQLIRQMTQLNSTLHQCLRENQRKDVKKAEEMIQSLGNLYQNLTQKLDTYKTDLKSLLEKSSSGTEQDQKLWDSIYLKAYRAVGTGIHWNFYRNLETTQKSVFLLGGENNNEFYSFSEYWEILNVDENGEKIGCDAIPEIA